MPDSPFENDAQMQEFLDLVEGPGEPYTGPVDESAPWLNDNYGRGLGLEYEVPAFDELNPPFEATPAEPPPAPEGEMNFAPVDVSQPEEEMTFEPQPVGPQTMKSGSAWSRSYNTAGPVERMEHGEGRGARALAETGLAKAQQTQQLGALAAEQGMRAANEEAAVRAENAAARQAQIEQEAADAQALNEKYSFRLQRHQQEINRERELVRSKKIQPDRFFANMTGFQRFMFIAAATLNGALSAQQGRGGVNETIQMAMKLAEQDINTQIADQDAAFKVLTSMEHDREILMAQHANEQLARTKAFALRLDAMTAGLEDRVAQLAPGKNAAAYTAALAALSQKSEEVWAQYSTMLLQDERARQQLELQDLISRRQAATARAQISESRRQFDQTRQDKIDAATTAPDSYKLGPDWKIKVGDKWYGGEDVNVPGMKEEHMFKIKEELDKRAESANHLTDLIGELKQIQVGKKEAADFTDAEVARVGQLVDQIKLAYSGFTGESVARSSDRDMRMIASVAGGDPARVREFLGHGNILRDEALGRLTDELETKMKHSVQRWGKMNGINYADVEWVKPPAFERWKQSSLSPVALRDEGFVQSKVLRGSATADAMNREIARTQLLAQDIAEGRHDADLNTAFQLAQVKARQAQEGLDYTTGGSQRAAGELATAAEAAMVAVRRRDAELREHNRQAQGVSGINVPEAYRPREYTPLFDEDAPTLDLDKLFAPQESPIQGKQTE